MKYIFNLFCIVLMVFSLSGCTMSYSFSGASISPDVKTVFIGNFPNRARIVNPRLSQTFEEALKDKFVSELGLGLSNGKADLEFTGQITGYETVPLGMQTSEDGRDYAAKNRFTITIKVKFVNNTDHDQDYNNSYSAYFDYDSNQSFTSIEQQGIEECLDQILDNVFNDSVANW